MRPDCGFVFPACYLADEAAGCSRDEGAQCKRQVVKGIRSGLRHIPGLLGVLLLLVAMPAWSGNSEPQPEPIFDIDIPASNAAEALNRLAEQTGAVLLFPYDLAESRPANAVAGRFTLMQALNAVLKDSGLTGGLSDKRVIQISAEEIDNDNNRGESMNVVKKTGLVALVAGLLSGGAVAEEVAAPQTETGTVVGKVTDARTGANLRGALIRVAGSGQVARTDSLGKFLLRGVPVGERSVQVSYLGYANASASLTVISGVQAELAFALRGGSDLEELIVYGQRSARAQALNQERTASNVTTVVSTDLLGNFTGTTISELLRRVPGVAFQQDSFTGDGTNIIVRGLEPDLNTVTLNGVELPVGDGEGRSASLNNILAESISSITISKTLLPNQDGGGTGGLVEIETKSPLDRPRRFANLLVEGAQRGNDFRDDLLVSGTVAGSFGKDDSFGLSASVQYRDRTNLSIGHSPSLLLGEYLPLEADGSTSIRSTRDIDPRREFPFEPGAASAYVSSFSLSQHEIPIENLVTTLSAEWQPVRHTNLRFDYTRAHQDRQGFRQESSLAGIGTSYQELPVASLGGEVRRTLNWSGLIGGRLIYNESDVDDLTEVYAFRGGSNFDQWQFDYNAGYTIGEQESRSRTITGPLATTGIDPSLVLPEAVDPAEGRILTLFGPRRGDGVQLPLLTRAGFDLLNDPASYTFQTGSSGGSNGENDRLTGGANVRRNFSGSFIQYLETGFQYELSEGRSRPAEGGFVIFGNRDIGSLGLTLDALAASRIGVDERLRTVSLASGRAFVSTMDSLIGEPGFFAFIPEIDPRRRETFLREEEWATYLQTAVEFGDVEIIGGVRVVSVNVRTRNLTSPFLRDENGVPDFEFIDRFTRLLDLSARQTDVLPRVLANYRPHDNLVFRGGYFLSVARPQISLLSDDQTVQLDLERVHGPNEDQPELRVSLGNPALRPSNTHNFDFSAEYYDDRIGVIKLGAFYKRIEDFIQNNDTFATNSLDGVPLPDDPRFQNLPDDILVRVTQPENDDEDAEIWGIEAAIERQFSFLPGAWGGLGVFANYTYTDSSKAIPLRWNAPIFDEAGDLIDREEQAIELSDVRFNEQPEHSGTFALTYNQYGIDSTLAYTYQDQRLATVRGNGLRSITDSVGTLDFRIEYRFGDGAGGYRIYLEGENLLRGTDDLSLGSSVGREDGSWDASRGGSYSGGREFRLGVSATF